jgi:flagellar hook-length control protein FliK
MEVKSNSDGTDMPQPEHGFASSFQPIIIQFLKNTELSGKVNKTVLKKFGDTYGMSDSQILPKNNHTEKLDKQFTSNVENQKQGEKSLTEKVDDNPKSNSASKNIVDSKKTALENSFKNLGSLKSNSTNGINVKIPTFYDVKNMNYSQFQLKSVQSINRIQVISKITQIVNQNYVNNNAQNATYKLNAGPLGELEIKLSQKFALTKAIVFVESESLKSDFEKLIPEIKENLNEKGMKFKSFNVEVNPNKEEGQNTKTFTQNISIEIEDKNDIQLADPVMRKFGYNTIEIIA